MAILIQYIWELLKGMENQTTVIVLCVNLKGAFISSTFNFFLYKNAKWIQLLHTGPWKQCKDTTSSTVWISFDGADSRRPGSHWAHSHAAATFHPISEPLPPPSFLLLGTSEKTKSKCGPTLPPARCPPACTHCVIAFNNFQKPKFQGNQMSGVLRRKKNAACWKKWLTNDFSGLFAVWRISTQQHEQVQRDFNRQPRCWRPMCETAFIHLHNHPVSKKEAATLHTALPQLFRFQLCCHQKRAQVLEH